MQYYAGLTDVQETNFEKSQKISISDAVEMDSLLNVILEEPSGVQSIVNTEFNILDCESLTGTPTFKGKSM